MQPGDVLLDKYRVEEVLGTGGMGKVVRASHLFLQKEFAIKVLLPHMADSAETVSRFLREAQATSKLNSEHIARVFDTGRLADGAPFMVMEYLQGNDLNQIIRHHGPQRPNVVCDLMLQACEGMAEAHSLGFVHRDIKPSNFFITTRADGSMLLKILDFGISKSPVGVTELTGSSTVIGTPTYMSPEQMKSGKAADARSDIWSMGIVMYQLLDGRPPFVGESYAELVLKVGSEIPPPISAPLPPGLMQVIMTCLEKNPMQRQQSIAELARMLAPYASDPAQGTQSAQRTQRILANRGAHVASLPVASGGGLTAPLAAPISPSQLTKRAAWGGSGPGSTANARGQVTHTHQVRGGEWRIGRIIGAFVVVIGAGIGGFVVKDMLSGGGDDDSTTDTTHVAAPPPVEPAPTPVVATPEPPRPEVKPEPPKPEPPKPEQPTELALTSEAPAARDESLPPPVETKPAVATKPVKPATTTTKTAIKPKPRPTKRRPKKDDALFNTRH